MSPGAGWKVRVHLEGKGPGWEIARDYSNLLEMRAGFYCCDMETSGKKIFVKVICRAIWKGMES